jgi:hypothetical protein
MAKDTNKSRAKNVSTNAHPNLEEEVRRRAYELYEERGRADGRDIDDWVRAEAEVTGRAVQTRAA